MAHVPDAQDAVRPAAGQQGAVRAEGQRLVARADAVQSVDEVAVLQLTQFDPTVVEVLVAVATSSPAVGGPIIFCTGS